jgi:DNA-directed RNA polymerase subunit RPC12/RpoP
MSDAEFITVFDAGTMGYRYWWVPACGLIPILFIVLRPKLIRAGLMADKPPMRPWVPIFGFVFAIFWTAIASFAIYNGQKNSREYLLSGHASYVEGEVQDFVPMPYAGHADESFTVKGVHFSYSDYGITPGFNNSASHGGPIRQGLYVRIWYSGNDILKLQLPKNAALQSMMPLPASAQPPLVSFSTFMIIFVGLGLGSWFFIMRLPTTQAKKFWNDRISILMNVLFFGFLCTQFIPTGNYSFLVVTVPFLAVIAWQNVRNTYFCEKCGKRSYNSEWLGNTYNCPNCGNKLR